MKHFWEEPKGKSERRSRGRPAHEPTDKDRKMVEVLAGYAVPAPDIADVLDIGQSTLYRHYRQQMRRGSAMVEAKLVGNLLRLAGGTNGTALKAIMFSLQCRFGWSPYAPGPMAPALGKKAQAELDAETALEDSDWGDLVH
jgi:hypothetical protein